MEVTEQVDQSAVSDHDVRASVFPMVEPRLSTMPDVPWSSVVSAFIQSRSERSLWQFFVEVGQLSVVVVNAEGRFAYVSPRCAVMAGKSASEMVGKRVDEVMVGEIGIERMAIFERALRGARPLLVVEAMGGMPMLTLIYRACDADGRPIGVICLHHVGQATNDLPIDRSLFDIIEPRASEVSPLSKLTDREREVLRLIALGASQAQIAKSIHRTIKTVEWHRAALGRKLGVATRIELARIALQNGLVKVDEPYGMSGMVDGMSVASPTA